MTQSNTPDRSPDQTLDRATSILERYGRGDDAELARRRFRDTSRARTVVVIGEVKRGKSSLVNALLGRRDLVPVDVDLCTGLPVRVHSHADPTGVDETRIRVHGPAGDRPEPRSELHHWARLSETTLPEGDEVPTGVAVDVAGSPLGDVVLVDTPGAGGLDDSAVRMALAEAGDAGVLVMVCDATTPITSGEMEILARAHESVGYVVVAVTKTDKNLRRWRDIVADDRRLVERHLGIRPPVVGVSCLRALDALDLDPDRRAQVERTSGIAELRAQIAEGLRAGDALPRIAGLRAARSALAGVAEDTDEKLRVVQQAEVVLPELEERRRHLEALRSHSQQWEQYLARNLSLARTHVAARVDEELDEIRERWTKTINRSGVRVLRSRPQIFTSQIEAELAGVLHRALAGILQALEAETTRLFPTEPGAWAQVAGPVMAQVAPPRITGSEVTRKAEGLFDPALLSMGVIGAGLLTAVIPFAPVAGGLWMGINLAYRAMKNGKTALLQWLRETTSTARTATNRLVDATATTARPEIVIRYRERIRRESETVQKLIEEARATQARTTAERTATVERLTRNSTILHATIDEVDGQIAALGVVR